MDGRRLAPDDARFPTTPAALALLRANGRAAEPAPLKKGDLPAAASKLPAPPLPPDGIDLGTHGNGHSFGLILPRLLDGRLLIQGSSGAGKSWLLRRLLEESAGRIQQVVIDPEGEFKSFAESADYPLVDAEKLDARAASALGRRVREQRLSLVLDVSHLDRESQLAIVASFCRALVECPREMWHPCLVAIDEAHLFAPFGGQSAESSHARKMVTSALVDLMSRGRKRGLAGVLATQRLARISKSVVSEASNFLIGNNSLDLDIRRAAEMIGWDAKRAFEQLPYLVPGQFVATGAAFNVSPVTAKIGPVRSHHLGASPAISAPPLPSAEDAIELLGIDRLEAETASDDRLPSGFKAVRGFILDPAAALALRIFQAIRPLHPDGALIASLPAELGTTPGAIASAIALLEHFNAVEMRGSQGPQLAVRVERGMIVRARA